MDPKVLCGRYDVSDCLNGREKENYAVWLMTVWILPVVSFLGSLGSVSSVSVSFFIVEVVFWE